MEKQESCFEGEVFSEILEVEGQKYEHVGFRDKDGKFGDFLAKNVGKKVVICFKIVEE